MATSSGITLPPPLVGLRVDLQRRWRALLPSERLWIGLALGLVGLVLVWIVFVAPAWRTLRDAPAKLDALDLQWQQMQRLAGESRDLRAAVPVSPAQSADVLRAATDRLGEHARLNLVADRATLTLTGVSGAALGTWLGEARAAARARPIEAQLTRGPQGYNGSVVLLLAAAPGGSAP